MIKKVSLWILKALWGMMKGLFHYSGLEFIYRKFVPAEKSTLPTGIIWLLGIYTAFFGIASQRYENRVDVIENRTNALLVLISNEETRNRAFGRVGQVQAMQCPERPEFLYPHITFNELV